MADIKAYKPESRSLSSGQVLSEPYDFSKARLVVREMTDLLVLDLVEKGLTADQMVLTIGYDVENLRDPARLAAYKGPVSVDGFGRSVPRHAHGSVNLGCRTSSARLITDAVMTLYDSITDPALTVRRMYVVANNIQPVSEAEPEEQWEQLDLFSVQTAEEKPDRQREQRRQEAILAIQKRYGKNAILKGMNLEKGATARDRNRQIGGHKA